MKEKSYVLMMISIMILVYPLTLSSAEDGQEICDDLITTADVIRSQCGDCLTEDDILNCEWSGARACLRITWTEEVEAWWTEERFNEQSNNSMIFFCNGEPVEIPVCLGPFWIEDTDCGTTEINGTEYPIYRLCGELRSGNCEDAVSTQPSSTIPAKTRKQLRVGDKPTLEDVLEDVNDDGIIDIRDIVITLNGHQDQKEEDDDLNGDGRVDILDLVIKSRLAPPRPLKKAVVWGGIKRRAGLL